MTGTTKSGGKTVATVTYTAPKGKAKTATKVTVPSKVTLKDGSTAIVTKVAAKAFASNKKIKTVVIPGTVTSVGKNAFSKCPNLKSVSIKGSSLETIEASAFQGCTSLTTVTIPVSVKTIGSKAFYGCKKLKTVTIKSTKLTKIGSNAFKGTYSKITFKCPKKQLAKYTKLIKKCSALLKGK